MVWTSLLFTLNPDNLSIPWTQEKGVDLSLVLTKLLPKFSLLATQDVRKMRCIHILIFPKPKKPEACFLSDFVCIVAN